MLVALTACAPNISPDVVQANNANTITQTTRGTIISIKPIQVKANDNMVGTLAGAGIGGVAGSAIGGGDRVPIIGAIGGALLGGAAGDYAQDKLSSQQGLQYIIKKNNGDLITVVQGPGATQYHVGESVYVVEGAHARIVAVG